MENHYSEGNLELFGFGKSVLSTSQFNREILLDLFEEARKMEEVFSGDFLKGKIMASVFFEPSTRTRFSFEVAMQRLGGSVVSNFDMQNNSSIKKSETLYDTGKTLSQMVDVIVARHPDSGSVLEIDLGSDVPVFNAGDGGHEHPSQGLLDLYTIWKEFNGRLDGLKIGLVGDLKHSRVLHSDFDLLRHFDVEFILISPRELALPEKYKNSLDSKFSKITETENLASVISDLDVISCNRLQAERFENPDDCEKYRGSFILSPELLSKGKNNLIILNPLPRREELPLEVDKDPRAKYFDQVKNGVPLRMALLKKALIA